MAAILSRPQCVKVPIIMGGNKIWWLCLVPTSTTRFASDVGCRMAQKWRGLYKDMTPNSLTESEEHDIPSQILKTIFGLHASVIFWTPICVATNTFVGSCDLRP